MEELHDRLASFIRVKEGRAHQRGREEGEPHARATRERGAKQTFGRGDRRMERR